MKRAPFLLSLVRKSALALKSARLVLDSGDYDSAVSRSYYAMFDMARAVLLRAVVTEDKLPRTHSGVIEAFRNHAIQSGRIDQELATQLSRTESLRMTADYTGDEIAPTDATETVRSAEGFVQTLERVYGLDESTLIKEFENRASKRGDGVSEPSIIAESRVDTNLDPVHLEDLRRQARENWLTLQRQRAGSV